MSALDRIALGAPGVYTFEDSQFYGIDYTSAMFTAGAFDEFAGPLNAFGSLRIQNCTIRTAASRHRPRHSGSRPFRA